MSLESAREFAKLAIQNQVIGMQVLAAISGKNQPEAAQAVSDLAASAGYRFTPGEGYTASQEALAAFSSGELSDEDLDEVAGGTYTSTYTSTGAGQAAGAIAGSVAMGSGAPVGAIVQGAVDGVQNGNPNNSAATNAAIGAGTGYNNFVKSVQDFFSSW